MELRLLGPVEVRLDGRLLDLGPPRQRCVFAALAVDVGRPVQVDTIVDRVWDESPPPSARESVYVYVGRLRKALLRALAPADLVRRSGGYQLEAETDQVDLHRFRLAVHRAGQPGRPSADRLAALRAAMAVWRGAPLADLDAEWA
ncbi:winged helix-turn-helix domain-containing protein [Actinoplanes sp. NPDC023801]|uniref:AfsR/SARP family transcriptional regulator n=1 Tax=Actinoplanes sp. NPDC023801 TaxID=3154595 RepID=UPI003400BFC7